MTKSNLNAVPPLGEDELSELELRWKDVPGGLLAPHRELIGQAGLFRVIENGVVVGIGKAAGGWGSRLSKRLSDFVRPSDSARKHPLGQFIYRNRDTLTLQVLVTGSDRRACDIANRLLEPMIAMHNPRENVPRTIVALAMKR